jgi:MEMO1 family protein
VARAREVSGSRLPAAAGRFYPARADELGGLVEQLLRAARPSMPDGELRALVAPHAGYAYSGAVAASAFAAIPRPAAELRVALFGPSHFVPLTAIAISDAASWQTPLGDAAVDGDLRDKALAAGGMLDGEPHRHDHALEVELPFLQRRAEAGLRILPVAVGGDDTAACSRLLSAVAGDALIVVSTDLSHYLDDATARARDRRTAAAVVALEDEAVRDADACGAAALRGLLAHARRAAWRCTILDLRTSADATGDSRRVVGYGAFAFTSRRESAYISTAS